MNAKAMKLFGALTGTADVRRLHALPSDATSIRGPALTKATAVDLVRGECLTMFGGRRVWNISRAYAPSRRVSCECGEAWITHEGEIEDYLLIPGTTLSVPAQGRTVVEALSPCRISIAS